MVMSMQSPSQSPSVCLATPESSQLCLMIEAKIITLPDMIFNARRFLKNYFRKRESKGM